MEAIVADRNQRQKYVERARIVLASADRGPAQRIAQGIGLRRSALRAASGGLFLLCHCEASLFSPRMEGAERDEPRTGS